METLLNYLNSVHPLSESLRDYLKSALKKKELPADGILLEEGSICDKICFIQQGLFKCYYLKNGVEVCTWFMKEGDVMISVFSFFEQVPSFERIQAMEDSIIYYISFEEYHLAKYRFPDFNFIRGNLLEHYYKLAEKRLLMLRMNNAAERFQFLFEHFRDLLNRVPEKYLATHIDMNPETFSRNKTKYFKEQKNSQKI